MVGNVVYATFVNTEDWAKQKIGISASRPYLTDLPILYWIKGNDFFTQVPPLEVTVTQIWKTRLRWTTLYPLHILSQEYWVGKAGFQIGRVALLLGTAMRKEERGRNKFITIWKLFPNIYLERATFWPLRFPKDIYKWCLYPYIHTCQPECQLFLPSLVVSVSHVFFLENGLIYSTLLGILVYEVHWLYGVMRPEKKA